MSLVGRSFSFRGRAFLLREGFFLGGSISLAKNLVNDLEGQLCGGGSYFDFSSSRFAQNIWAYFKNFYVFSTTYSTVEHYSDFF